MSQKNNRKARKVARKETAKIFVKANKEFLIALKRMGFWRGQWFLTQLSWGIHSAQRKMGDELKQIRREKDGS